MCSQILCCLPYAIHFLAPPVHAFSWPAHGLVLHTERNYMPFDPYSCVIALPSMMCEILRHFSLFCVLQPLH